MEDYFHHFAMSDFFLEELRKKEKKIDKPVKIPDKNTQNKDNKN
tara:strand:+ start:3799 stop:3930 length:132 start_codon:yes stop_codon:yes gene_type:complete